MDLRSVARPVLAGAAGFAFGASMVLVFDDVPVPPPVPTVLLAVGVGLALAVLVATLVVVLGRRDRADRELVRVAVRTGRLPDGDDVLLHRLLWQRSVQLRSWRWSWLGIAAIQLALGITHVVDASQSVYSRVFWGLDIVLWVVVAVFWTARARWERPKVERLLDELDERMPQRADV